MNHIHSGPATVISLIRTNLKDRYESGFPVLKELIQNADDAGAKTLRLGWAAAQSAPGKHPLLSGPALFAVNDGPFDKHHAWAICEVGLSSKSGDVATIGKFGLGMKSVFHFSEAVYYLAQCHLLDGGATAGQLNPWCAPGMRPPPLRQGWAEFAEEHCRWLRERMGTLLPSPQHFLLWMPLRLECHHDRKHPPLIVANFDDYRGPAGAPDDPIFVPGHVEQIAGLLPMLHDLETVEVWRLDGNGPARRVSAVRLEAGKVSRCLRPDRMKMGQLAPLGGEVQTRSTDQAGHVFGGVTLLLDSPTVRSLSESEYWPSGLRIEDQSFVSEREKAPPHVGVCWRRCPAEGTAQLECSWGVYLPLSDEAERSNLQGAWSYSLLLHGWFFVDAGRKLFRVAGVLPSQPVDETSLRREWNRELMNAGTLPLIPQSLLELQRRAGMSAEQMKQLVEGLTLTRLFARNRAASCSLKQWGHRWRASGANWELVEPGDLFLEIPDPAGRLNPVDALPYLKDAAGRHVLTPSGWPRLARQEGSVIWPEEELASVLDSAVPEQLYANPRKLEYVVEFCEQTRPNVTLIVPLVRRLLARPLKELGEQVELLMRLVKLIPVKQRLAIPVKDDPAGREVWRKMEALALPLLLTPQACDPAGDPGIALLPINAGASILQSIALPDGEQVTSAAEDLRGQIAQLVLERTVPAGRSGLLELCPAHRVFRVYEAREEKDQATLSSWSDLDARWKQGTLFKRQGTMRSGAFALRKALPREPITLISETLGDLVFGPNKITACDAEACAKVVLRQTDRAALVEEGRRGELLDFFLKSPQPVDGFSFRRAVAVLLHGQLPVPPGQPDLFIDGGANERIWARITKELLARQEESWRLVNHDLSSRVPENRHAEFSLRTVGREAVISLLQTQPPGVRLNLSAPERDELLRHLDSQLELLRRLCIHAEYTNGTPVEGETLHAITDRSYWHNGFDSPALRGHVTLLRLSDVPARRETQKQLAPLWDARAAVEVVLSRLNPGDHWRILLGALEQSNAWPNELLQRLKSAAWLPRTGARALASPCDVIDLKEIRETVTRVLAAATTKAFVDAQDLAEGVRQHENFPILAKNLFPPEGPALEMLGEVLGEDEAFHVGCPEALTHPAGLNSFRKAFHNAPEDVMRAAAIIAEVVRKISRDDCVNGLLKPLRKPLSINRLKRILAHLSGRHEENQGSSEQRAQILEVHGWYLRELAANGQAFRDALSGPAPIRLLSGEGHWKPPAQLCLGAENIDADHRLEHLQRVIIEPYLPASVKEAPAATSAISRETGPTPTRSDGPAKAAEELKAYFKPWLDYQPGLQVVIGGFIALLGGHPNVKQLAKHYLGHNYHVGNVRQRLRLPKDEYGRTGEAQVDQFMVIVQRSKGQPIAVNNLCGQRITVPQSKEVEDLFIPYAPASPFQRITGPQGDPKSYRVVWLREFSPASVGDRRLVGLIRKAAGKIVAEFYNQHLGTGLDDLFRGLKEDDIHQIRVAETYLLDHAPASLRQFDLTTQPRLRDLLRRMDEVHRLQAEENVAAVEGAVVERHSDELRRQVQQEFRQALEDHSVCAALLDAVRRKINGHYQYSESSVPFELLQNADDACVEFERLGGTPGDWFSITFAEDCLAFLHGGRPINVTAPGDVSLTDCGFHRDLEKMLMLSTSDKQTGEETSTVTGKFGLGFKSVFLICDRPRALSRSLGFQVAGALLPRPLATADRQQMEERYKVVTGSDVRVGQGTIFSLPLRPEAKPETTLGRFRRLLPVQLAFTQRIRKCHLHGLFPEQKTTEWSEQTLPHAAGWAVGMLDSPDPESLLNRRMATVLRLGDKKALLLGLDPHGFTALPEEVPSIWVTAPTVHGEKLGMALNAPFALDVGRANLASDLQAHQALTNELGFAVGAALERLFDAVNDHWEDARQALGLLDRASAKDLWRSLWLVLGEKMANRARHSASEGHKVAFDLLKCVFWGEGQGLTRLYAERCALPTGLAGDHDVLTKRSLVEKRLRGCLDEEEDQAMFRLAAGWPRARVNLYPGSIVSGARVWDRLSLLSPGGRYAEPIDLSDLLSWELLAEPIVTPGCAVCFGAVVKPDLLQRLENSSSGRPEADRIRIALRSARFRNRAGKPAPAERLLVATTTNPDRRDETRRAAFAPAERVLADEYEGAGLDFFFACRPALKATVDDLISWARTSDGEQRAKFLEYLNHGDLSSPLAHALRQQTDQNDWWQKAEEFRAAAGHARGEIDEGFVRAVVGQTQPTSLPFPPPEPGPSPTFDPTDVLPRLARWWHANRADWLVRYRDWVYPAFLRASLTPRHTLSLSPDDLSIGLQGRKRWLSLFILGMTHGLGRGGQYAQQHRGFLDLCERQKWLDVFADPKVTERRADWIALVDAYLDKQQADPEYYNWLRQLFISIRAVAVRLEDYAEAFRALRSKGPVRLDDVLRPRNSPTFQGGGVDPPSLARVLSLGACFVARELVRGGFIPPDRKQVHPFCYPPVRSIRRLLGKLESCPNLEGDQPDSWNCSTLIHRFLGNHLTDPTFEGDFDIPLWLLSRHAEIQHAVLKEVSSTIIEVDEDPW